MYKVLVWGTGCLYNEILNLIKMYEMRGDFQVVGVTSNDTNMKDKVDGYNFVQKKNVSILDFDFCLVASTEFESVKQEAGSYGIDVFQLIPARVLSIPYFSFDQYIRLKRSRLSILASNCWAGICYHYLGLEFLSPTINMFFGRRDFNKFLSRLEYYLSIPLESAGNRYGQDIQRYYPVGKLGDICIYFNHYETFEEAESCWERRKAKINRDNLLVITSTTSMEEAEEFDELHYENKLVFVPFDCDFKSAYKIVYEDKGDGVTIGMTCNNIANGRLSDFDILRFLNHEKGYIRIE